MKNFLGGLLPGLMMGEGADKQQMLLGLLAPTILGGLGQEQEDTREQRLRELHPERFLGPVNDSPFAQMAGMVNQYANTRDMRQMTPQANQFASQTPGDPRTANRMGNRQQGDIMAMLDAAIARRMGG